MSLQEDFRKKNKPVNVKAIFDLVMGLIYVVMGGALAASKYIGFELTFTSPEAVVIFWYCCNAVRGLSHVQRCKTV